MIIWTVWANKAQTSLKNPLLHAHISRADDSAAAAGAITLRRVAVAAPILGISARWARILDKQGVALAAVKEARTIGELAGQCRRTRRSCFIPVWPP
jgi:hypothetical protein